MSAKTIANFNRFARERGHLSLVPPHRVAPTLPPPSTLPDDLELKADALDRQAAQLMERSRELRATAEAMRKR